METLQIEQLISKTFSNVEKIKERVMRAELLHERQLVGIYYFDYSQNFNEENFDLGKYQDELISEDYYTNIGAIQWNYYLYFIYDSGVVKGELKESFEKNTVFTRKHIISFRDFKEWIKNKPGLPLSKKVQPEQDISSIWIKELRKHKLDGVFLRDYSYKEVVRKYIEGRPIEEPEDTDIQVSNLNNGKIDIINKLILESYRRYPKERKFIFEQVNLLSGPNGTGKTSLLEAIELCLCGKTRRNERKPEKADISIYYPNGNYDKYEAGNNKKYQQRDHVWYGNYYPKGNRLCHSFSKYNFYDSDAAYRIVNEKDYDPIQKAFISIALGQNANFINERMEKVLDGFEESLKLYKREYESLETRIGEERKIIDRFRKQKSDSSIYFKSFINNATKINWNGYLPKKIEDNFIKFENEYSEIEVLLKELISIVDWLDTFSLEIIRKENDRCTTLMDQVKTCEKDIGDTKEDIEKNNKYFENTSSLSKLLKDILPYLEEEQINMLVGLKDKIEKIQKDKEKYFHIDNLSEKINFALVADQKVSIEEYGEKIEKAINDNKINLQVLNNKIDGVKLTLSQLDGLIKEIKVNGESYLRLNPNAKNCPLCGTSYETSELRKRIIHIKDDMKHAKILEDLLKERATIEKELSKTNLECENLFKIKQVAAILFDSTVQSKIKIDEISKKSSRTITLLKSSEKELDSLLVIQQKFIAKSLNEEKYMTLTNRTKELKPDLSLKYEDRVSVNRLNKALDSDLSAIKEKQKQQTEILEGFITKRDNLLATYFKGEFYKTSGVRHLEKRKEVLGKALSYCDRISKTFDVNPKKTISDISLELQQLKSIFDNFKDSVAKTKNNSEVISQCKINIKKIEREMTRNEPKKRRAEEGGKALETILTTYDKEGYLKKFIKENKTLIIDIFQAIHSPREFSDIDFENGNSERIHLVRENSKSKIPLTQISSGQRAALAISIFLALNKKAISGPRFIILDEPISYIDDLNILSFFDYLRDLAMYAKKQIFFTTASPKIAALFQRKFEFLKDDFRLFELLR